MLQSCTTERISIFLVYYYNHDLENLVQYVQVYIYTFKFYGTLLAHVYVNICKYGYHHFPHPLGFLPRKNHGKKRSAHLLQESTALPLIELCLEKRPTAFFQKTCFNVQWTLNMLVPPSLCWWWDMFIYIIYFLKIPLYTTCEFQQDLQLADLLVGRHHRIISAEQSPFTAPTHRVLLQVSSHRWLAYGDGFHGWEKWKKP